MKLSNTTVKTDPGAMRHNIRELKKLTDLKLMPVIKSDAYGHGIVETGRLLEAEGIWGLGISEPEEIDLLREAGIKSRLFLLAGFWPDDAESVIKDEKVIPGICAREQLDALEAACSLTGKGVDVHLKLDTGMGRYGFSPGEFMDIAGKRDNWPSLSFTGIYSHLANAGEPDNPLNRKQYETLHDVVMAVSGMGWHPEEIHMANSSGLIHNRADRLCTMARPGIALYGAYPDESAQNIIELVPAMTVSAPVHSVRLMKEGETTGYGSTYTFTRETSLAILKTGYGCGYPRAMSNRADVLINGVRCPVVGRVCMQAVMVDASFAGEVRAGDEAVLWGRQQGRLIRPEEAAAWAGTISYELMCLAGKINNRKSGGDNKDYVWNRSS